MNFRTKEWRWAAGAALGFALVAGFPVVACSGSTSGSLCSGMSCPSDSNVDVGSSLGDVALTDRESGIVDAGVIALDDAGCPAGRGPKMVRIPGAEGGTYCIDSTEVTNAQYAAFLTAKGNDTSGQPPQCAGNSSFAVVAPDGAVPQPPCGYDPALRANYPVTCVNWCDAHAFCAWAAKELCSTIIESLPLSLPQNPYGEWINACTASGRFLSLYGSTPVPGKCVDNTFDAAQPVGSLASCQSADPRFAGVFDLIGNVAEMLDNCIPVTGLPSDLVAGVENKYQLDGGGQICFAISSTFRDNPLDCVGRAPTYAGPNLLEPLLLGIEDRGFRCCTSQ